jgi:polyisoprenoid-binding protein YceI
MTEWTFEPGHTSAQFRARHMMVTNVRGHFQEVTGEMTFDPDDVSKGSVRAEIDTSSLCSGDQARDEHLTSADFLHAEEYPKIRYEGEEVEEQGCSEFVVHGELTIRGITRAVPLETCFLGIRETGYWDGEADQGPVRRAGFQATAQINRHEFNVDWQNELPGGGFVVGETVWITLDVEALPTSFLENL